MKKVIIFIFLILTIVFILPADLFAQKESMLVIFPFAGSSIENGNLIASKFSYQDFISSMFLVARIRIDTSFFFHRDGSNDIEVMLTMGKQFGASYILIGSISLSDGQNSVLLEFFNAESRLKIAQELIVFE
ncbi:MAG: hypothetical protein FWC06_03715, partial [Treponema sp.]|nr:hypothetical protein [Treponema sp.]